MVIPVDGFCNWLSHTPLSAAFRSIDWFVPFVQTIHIIAVSILLTSTYLVSFRLLRLGHHSSSLAAVVFRLTPWTWGAIVVLLVTGLFLIITEPARELLNWVFRTKMFLVASLTVVMVYVQARLRQDSEYWSGLATRRFAGRCVGLLIFLLGACIVTAGRWIAYV
jgi:hypothetical protein